MNKSKGFSLLEILVAFSILSVSLGILLKIFSSGVNTAIVAENYTVATQIAESLMVKTGVESALIEELLTGVEDGKYRWSVEVSKIANPVDATDNASNFMAVKVNIEWGEGKDKRFFELNGIKTGSNG